MKDSKKRMISNPPSVVKGIPNFFTLLNLVFGCIAIVLILQTGETIVLMDDGGVTQLRGQRMYIDNKAAKRLIEQYF